MLKTLPCAGEHTSRPATASEPAVAAAESPGSADQHPNSSEHLPSPSAQEQLDQLQSLAGPDASPAPEVATVAAAAHEGEAVAEKQMPGRACEAQPMDTGNVLIN